MREDEQRRADERWIVPEVVYNFLTEESFQEKVGVGLTALPANTDSSLPNLMHVCDDCLCRGKEEDQLSQVSAQMLHSVLQQRRLDGWKRLAIYNTEEKRAACSSKRAVCVYIRPLRCSKKMENLNEAGMPNVSFLRKQRQPESMLNT